MKFLRNFGVLCALALSQHAVGFDQQIAGLKESRTVKFEPLHAPYHPYDLGTATFIGTDPANWYDIDTVEYPAIVPLSLNRNAGFTRGEIELNDTGVTVEEEGNYWVSFNAILSNNGESASLIPVFLVRDGEFDLTPGVGLDNVVSVPNNGVFTTVQQSGVLERVRAGTNLSLAASHAGGNETQTITIVGWNISLFKIPADEYSGSSHHRRRRGCCN